MTRRIEDAVAIAEEVGGKVCFRADPVDPDVVEPLILRLEIREPEGIPLATFAVYPLEGGDALLTAGIRLKDLARLVEQAQAGEAPTGDDLW
jgi:hypothetical protein